MQQSWRRWRLFNASFYCPRDEWVNVVISWQLPCSPLSRSHFSWVSWCFYFWRLTSYQVFAKPFVGAMSGHRDVVSCMSKNPKLLNCLVSVSMDGGMVIRPYEDWLFHQMGWIWFLAEMNLTINDTEQERRCQLGGKWSSFLHWGFCKSLVLIDFFLGGLLVYFVIINYFLTFFLSDETHPGEHVIAYLLCPLTPMKSHLNRSLVRMCTFAFSSGNNPRMPSHLKALSNERGRFFCVQV